LLELQDLAQTIATFFGPRLLAGIHHVCYRAGAIGPAPPFAAPSWRRHDMTGACPSPANGRT